MISARCPARPTRRAHVGSIGGTACAPSRPLYSVKLHHAQLLAVGVEFVDQVGGDLDAARHRSRTCGRVAVSLIVEPGRHGRPRVRSGRAEPRRRPSSGWMALPSSSMACSMMATRIAVEIGIGEVTSGRAGVIEDGEGQFAVVLAHTRAAPDDLLELGHGVDHAHEHDILARGCIDARGEQLRSGEDDRGAGFDVLEVTQVTTADVAFVGRDAANVVGVLDGDRRSGCSAARRISSACS